MDKVVEKEKRTSTDNWFFVFCCFVIILATITIHLAELGEYPSAIKGMLLTGALLTFAFYVLIRGERCG